MKVLGDPIILRRRMAGSSGDSRRAEKLLVGWVLVGWDLPSSLKQTRDVEASRQATMQVRRGWEYCWYADPVILGQYPEDDLQLLGDALLLKLPRRISNDAPNCSTSTASVSTPAFRLRLGLYGKPVHPIFRCDGHTTFPLEGDARDPGLARLKFTAEMLELSIVIMKNGMSNCDWVALDGRVHDGPRIDYSSATCAHCTVINEGADARGIFIGRSIENFESGEARKTCLRAY